MGSNLPIRMAAGWFGSKRDAWARRVVEAATRKPGLIDPAGDVLPSLTRGLVVDRGYSGACFPHNPVEAAKLHAAHAGVLIRQGL